MVALHKNSFIPASISYLLLLPNYPSVSSHLEPPPLFWELCIPEVPLTIFHSSFSRPLPPLAPAHQSQGGTQASHQGPQHTPRCVGTTVQPQKLLLLTASSLMTLLAVR